MIKSLFYISLFFLLNCSGYEFVYKDFKSNPLINNVETRVVGDDKIYLTSYIRESISENKKDNEYILDIKSKKISENLIIQSDQTATEIQIIHNINYKLYKKIGGCLIFDKKFRTKSTYKIKSSGYNFGTDTAKKQTTENNISNNINDFFTFINNNYKNIKCVNDS